MHGYDMALRCELYDQERKYQARSQRTRLGIVWGEIPASGWNGWTKSGANPVGSWPSQNSAVSCKSAKSPHARGVSRTLEKQLSLVNSQLTRIPMIDTQLSQFRDDIVKMIEQYDKRRIEAERELDRLRRWTRGHHARDRRRS